jgi:hypothetical protein
MHIRFRRQLSHPGKMRWRHHENEIAVIENLTRKQSRPMTREIKTSFHSYQNRTITCRRSDPRMSARARYFYV